MSWFKIIISSDLFARKSWINPAPWITEDLFFFYLLKSECVNIERIRRNSLGIDFHFLLWSAIYLVYINFHFKGNNIHKMCVSDHWYIIFRTEPSTRSAFIKIMCVLFHLLEFWTHYFPSTSLHFLNALYVTFRF